jgi:Na+:H+ antiporter, NhaA family
MNRENSASKNHSVFINDVFLRFFQHESFSGIILLLAAIVALVMANSPWKTLYALFLDHRITIGFLSFSFSLSVHHWINDTLMAVFFLVVGLEIKRQLLTGELSNSKKALLPIIAAAGGMVIPGIFFLIFNPPGSAFSKGWGIPTVTDIAFSLGVLALLGNRVPLFLKVFLTALAIADDLGAVLIIALFYSAQIHWIYLALVLFIWGILFLLNQFKIQWLPAYIVLGILLWSAMHASGIHTSIAGVLLAFAIPASSQNENSSPLQRLENYLHPWVTYAIMPLFAFANAGVTVSASISQSILHPVSLGVITGLLIGKPVGIFTLSWLSIRLKLAELPSNIQWIHLYGLACLGGIGFTMSLFIANLAFENTNVEIAKIGILTASVLAGLWGAVVLWKTLPTAPEHLNEVS